VHRAVKTTTTIIIIMDLYSAVRSNFSGLTLSKQYKVNIRHTQTGSALSPAGNI